MLCEWSSLKACQYYRPITQMIIRFECDIVWWCMWSRINIYFTLVTATEEEAAEAYDIAAIKFRGANAVTNFEMSRYDVEAIMKSSLPVGGAAKRLKLSLESEQKPTLSSSSNSQLQPQCANVSGSINFSAIHPPVASIPCGIPFDSVAAYYHHNLFHHFHPTNTGTAESALTSSTNATGLTALPPAAAAAPEFFIWPHQSYWALTLSTSSHLLLISCSANKSKAIVTGTIQLTCFQFPYN